MNISLKNKMHTSGRNYISFVLWFCTYICFPTDKCKILTQRELALHCFLITSTGNWGWCVPSRRLWIGGKNQEAGFTRCWPAPSDSKDTVGVTSETSSPGSPPWLTFCLWPCKLFKPTRALDKFYSWSSHLLAAHAAVSTSPLCPFAVRKLCVRHMWPRKYVFQNLTLRNQLLTYLPILLPRAQHRSQNSPQGFEFRKMDT